MVTAGLLGTLGCWVRTYGLTYDGAHLGYGGDDDESKALRLPPGHQDVVRIHLRVSYGEIARI